MVQRFNLSQFSWHLPGKGEELPIYAAAILAAQRLLGRHSRHDHVLDKLEALAEQLKPRDAHDGVALAKKWLAESRIDAIDIDPLQKMYSAISREVDTDDSKSTLSVGLDVLETMFAARDFGMSKSLASAIVAAVEVEPTDRIACAFPMSAAIAVQLAQKNEVVLFASDPTISMVVAMVGIATGANLIVDRRDPLSHAYLGTRRGSGPNPWEGSKFEHLISMPPLGAYYDLGSGEGRKTAETLQFEGFRDRWSKSLTTIVADGFLSRTTIADIALRRSLLEKHSAVVTSLPPAVWGRSSGLHATLLQIESAHATNVIFVDGRSMPKGRPSVSELARHIEELPWWYEQPERYADVPLAAVAADQFNLSVDRFVKSALVQQMEEALNSRPTVSLGDIAEIVRPQSARPLRDEETGDAFEALEVTTSDIDEAALLTPARRVRFAPGDAERVLKSAVRPGDIVISVKGRAGVVGIVPDRAPTEPGRAPWVISQSFAILRVSDRNRGIDPRVLGSLLSALWAQEKLRALAGGSTVPMISMTDLRGFKLPLLDPDALSDASHKLEEVEILRQQLAVARRNLQKKREKISASLWGMPLNGREDVNA